MEQLIRIYTADTRRFGVATQVKEAAEKMVKEGFIVHTMVSTGNFGTSQVVVVYQREKG